MGDEEHKQEQGAERSFGEDGNGDEQGATDTITDGLRAVRGDSFEDVSEEEGQQVTGDEGAEDTDRFEHFDKAGALGGGFGFRELLAHEHHGVKNGGHEVEGELNLP